MKAVSKIAAPVHLNILTDVFDRQVLHGVSYGYGVKPPTLHSDPSEFEKVDCSGEFRYLLAKGSMGKMIVPDGSIKQREWCEWNLVEKRYRDLAMADKNRLFACFITPGINGCGKVGHVWLVGKFDTDWLPDTMESYGGHGVGSRDWNNRTLWRMVHKCFEIPTVKASNVTV
jgi:hypothetical protein